MIKLGIQRNVTFFPGGILHCNCKGTRGPLTKESHGAYFTILGDIGLSIRKEKIKAVIL